MHATITDSAPLVFVHFKQRSLPPMVRLHAENNPNWNCNWQDPYFDLHLVGACLQLAAPHLEVPPPLVTYLEKSGYFKLNAQTVSTMQKHAKTLLNICRGELVLDWLWVRRPWSQLVDAAVAYPWLFELKQLVVENNRRLPKGGCSHEQLQLLADQSLVVSEMWGTAWSRVARISEVRQGMGGLRKVAKGKEVKRA